MNIDIQCHGFKTTNALSNHAKRRLRFVLTRHSDRIARILVRLGAMNGPRGDGGKYCRIQVDLLDAQSVVSIDTGADIHDVIDRAADRAGRAVVKHLDRPAPLSRLSRDETQARASGPLGSTSRPNHSQGALA